MTMRRLILLRHAKTERAEPGERDRDRKLMKRGRADAPIVGAYLAHHGLAPDLALVSPAERAQETWRLVAAALDKRPRAEIDERLYKASPQKLLEIIAEPRKARSLLIVGHNPSLHEFALPFIASGTAETRNGLGWKSSPSASGASKMPMNHCPLRRRHAPKWNPLPTPRLPPAA